MSITLAFDVYGTLIDVGGLVHELGYVAGENAEGFGSLWREKQLEYSFRRGLMQSYENFSICTRQALDYACLQYQLDLTTKQKDQLLDFYSRLPLFDDVLEGLDSLQEQGVKLYAFSNGSVQAVDDLLSHAGIRNRFLEIISADEIKTFKPNPAVYDHFLKRSNASKTHAWVVSSNPFDVIGAISAGLNGAWIKRSNGQIFDPWGVEPTMTLKSLVDIQGQLIVAD